MPKYVGTVTSIITVEEESEERARVSILNIIHTGEWPQYNTELVRDSVELES